MKAIVCTRFGTPDALELREVEQPSCRDNEVRVKVSAATVTPSDIAGMGVFGLARLFRGGTRPREAIPGVEFAGEIEAVGKNVRRFAVGNQVFGSAGGRYGAWAEYLCLPEAGVLAMKPANLDYGEAAAIGDGALTALLFLRDHAKIKGGQTVLINGASGSVGTAAVQLARYFGAEVRGVCSTANLQLVQSLGAGQVIDYTREDFTRSGQRHDIIFDAVGKTSFARCRSSLQPQGVYLTTVPGLAIIQSMLMTARGSSQKAIFAATGLAKPGVRTRALHLLKELAESGQLKTVISRRYPLDQFAEALRYVRTGHKIGNVIISFGPGH